MPFTNNPAGSATDRLRLVVGDVLSYPVWLEDEIYTFLLDKYNNNEVSASMEAARYILGRLTHGARERCAEVEVYGRENFQSYMQFLTFLLTDTTSIISTLASARGYAGGVSVSDMEANDANPDNIKPRFYRGFTEGKRVWEE